MTDKQAREGRMQRLKLNACQARAQVEEQLQAHFGSLLPGHLALLDAWQDVELTRLEAAESISATGLRERYYNGRQSLERKNPAVDIMLRAAATEAKLISAMGLTRRRQGAAALNGGDAADDGEDMDDY